MSNAQARLLFLSQWAAKPVGWCDQLAGTPTLAKSKSLAGPRIKREGRPVSRQQDPRARSIELALEKSASTKRNV